MALHIGSSLTRYFIRRCRTPSCNSGLAALVLQCSIRCKRIMYTYSELYDYINSYVVCVYTYFKDLFHLISLWLMVVGLAFGWSSKPTLRMHEDQLLASKQAPGSPAGAESDQPLAFILYVSRSIYVHIIYSNNIYIYHIVWYGFVGCLES